MSRLKNYTWSVISSYALLGANVVYTLASIPIALKYLTKAEFGLWALTLQLAHYIAMVDLGMGSSISRILIDHKDDRAGGRYGSALQSAFLVCAAQGAIVLVVGMSLVWFLGSWLRVPEDLARPFLWLMIGQVALTAANFVTRLFGQVLYAWQRIDVSNYIQILQLATGLGVLWVSFEMGLGVYSLLAGSAASWLFGAAAGALSCHRLGFRPRSGEWGRASRRQFRELFVYGADLFLISLGTQLVVASQTVLVSRQLGIEAAALWSIMTKVFTLVTQMVYRVIGNAMPAFAEMFVRKETDRMWTRYRVLFSMVTALSGIGAVLFAACNGPFVMVWTDGRFAWPPINDVLLSVWMILLAQQCCHNSLIMCLKQVRGLKYVFLLEGAAFVIASVFLLPVTGTTGMLVCSLVATTLFTWTAGTWRVARLLGGATKALLLDWQRPLIRIVVVLVPCWLILDRAIHTSELWQLLINGSVLSALGFWVLVRYALPFELTAELVRRLPVRLRAVVSLLPPAIFPSRLRQVAVEQSRG